MPKKPRKPRIMRPTPISAKLKVFFETGALVFGDDPNVCEEDGDIFVVACSDQKLLATWLPYREQILADWKREKRSGLPWIETYLNEHTG